MISENQTIRRPKSLVQRIRRVVLVEWPAWQLLILAAVVGVLWAVSLFDWDFVTGMRSGNSRVELSAARRTTWRPPSLKVQRAINWVM
jgi:hypothetical protein